MIRVDQRQRDPDAFLPGVIGQAGEKEGQRRAGAADAHEHDPGAR
jgi:hypothetical protein